MHVVDERTFSTDDFNGTVVLGVWMKGICQVVICNGDSEIVWATGPLNEAKALEAYKHPAVSGFYGTDGYFFTDVTERIAEYV